MLTIDTREFQEHPELSELPIPKQIQKLDAGDYALLDRTGDAIGIERATIPNLMDKLQSGELESQLERCFASYKQVILLTEGVYDSMAGMLAIYKQGEKTYWRAKVYPNTYFNSLQSLLDRLGEFGVQVIQSPNFSCSMDTIVCIYKGRREPEEKHTLLKRTRPIRPPTRLTTNPAVGKLMGLTERLPEKVAIRLLQKYQSILHIIAAVNNGECDVEGFGKGLQDNFRKSIGL